MDFVKLINVSNPKNLKQTLNFIIQTCNTNGDAIAALRESTNKAVSFVNYSTMIASLNTLNNTVYGIGQDIMIVTLQVPDLWISDVAEEAVTYTYVSDADFVNELNTNGSVQIGYYKLSALETQKVDLSGYATNEALATKVDRQSNPEKFFLLYGQTPSGNDTRYIIASTAAAGVKGRIPQYFEQADSNGDNAVPDVLISGDPEKPYHVANKNYVDVAVANAGGTTVTKKDDNGNVVELKTFDSDTKVNRITDNAGFVYLYSQNANGTDSKKAVAVNTFNAKAGNIPQYFLSNAPIGEDIPTGVLVSGDPVNPYHAANKGYVDTEVGKKLDKVTTEDAGGLTRVYAIKYTGEPHIMKLNPNAGPNQIVSRDSNGRAKVNDPSNERDIANKRYVDNAIANAGGGGGKLYKRTLHLIVPGSAASFYIPARSHDDIQIDLNTTDVETAVAYINKYYGGTLGIFSAPDQGKVDLFHSISYNPDNMPPVELSFLSGGYLVGFDLSSLALSESIITEV